MAHSWVHCQRSYSWVGRISALIIPTYLQIFSICDWHGKGLSREPKHSFSRDSVSGFGSERITQMIHFLSSVISTMVVPTWCHGPIWGNSLPGECKTNDDERISEFTLCNWAIHLSKVKPSAIPFASHFAPLLPSLLQDLGNFALHRWSCTEQPEILFSDALLTVPHAGYIHAWFQATGMSFSCRCGLLWYLVRLASCGPNSWRTAKLFNAHSSVDRLPYLRGNHAQPCILGLDPNQLCNSIGP